MSVLHATVTDSMSVDTLQQHTCKTAGDTVLKQLL